MLIAVATADAHHLGVLSSRAHTLWALRAGGWLGIGNDPRYSKSRCFDPFPFPDANDMQKQRIRAIAEELDAHRKRVLAEHAHLTLTGLYNVLERLRAGVAPDALDEKERRIFDDGLVLILKELHEKLDAAVADAYGWPVDLSGDDILARLVALNKERAQEEARGLVRWLRPDYQIPRFGTPKERKELELVGGKMREGEEIARTAKVAFPKDDYSQTIAVLTALAAAAGPLDAQTIALRFKRGGRVTAKVESVLTSLARTGLVDSVDDGKKFLLRRAA